MSATQSLNGSFSNILRSRWKMVSQELWCWLCLKHGLVYGFIDAVNKTFAVSNILTSVAQDRYLWLFAVVLVKSILTRRAIFLHERSCIWLIYWGKLKFMCVNLCKIMKSIWFMNHILRYSDLNSVIIFIIFLRE